MAEREEGKWGKGKKRDKKKRKGISHLSLCVLIGRPAKL